MTAYLITMTAFAINLVYLPITSATETVACFQHENRMCGASRPSGFRSITRTGS